METDFMRIGLVITFFISFSSYGAIKKSIDELAKYRSEVMEMGARLSSLEKQIGSKNNVYLSSLEQIKQFEADVKIYREELSRKQKEVSKTENENKRILQSYILESENDTTELWQRKVHLELLKQAQKKLMSKESELIGFKTCTGD